MLALKNLSYKTPPPAAKTVFEDIDFCVPEGVNTLVLGENGSGKTTLLRLLLKLASPFSGEVEGGTEKASAFFEDVESQLFFTQVREELQVAEKDPDIYKKCLEMLNLKDIISRSVIELSYSQKARLALGCAYMAQRPFIIIDSPPRDSCIEKAIDYFSSGGKYTHLLLLPEGDNRIKRRKWEKFKICKTKIKKA